MVYMKLKFDKNLEYQQQAIASVVDLFRGQTPMHTNFTVSAYNGQIGLFNSLSQALVGTFSSALESQWFALSGFQ
jgi:restriction endonuclease